jgi:hypothetical protein
MQLAACWRFFASASSSPNLFFFSSHVTIVDFGLKFDLAGREAEKKWEVHTYTTPDFRSSKWIGALKIYHLFV